MHKHTGVRMTLLLRIRGCVHQSAQLGYTYSPTVPRTSITKRLFSFARHITIGNNSTGTYSMYAKPQEEFYLETGESLKTC